MSFRGERSPIPLLGVLVLPYVEITKTTERGGVNQLLLSLNNFQQLKHS
jgi:hypothetical protein